MTKFSNFILFSVLLALFFIFQPYKNFSTNLSSILTQEDKEKYILAKKFTNSTILLVSVEGFNEESLLQINQIKKDLLQHSDIFLHNQFNNSQYKEYQQKYRLYLNEWNYKNANDVNISNILEQSYIEIISSSVYSPINTKDPLGIIKHKRLSHSANIKNGHLALGNYGYLAIFFIKSVNITESRVAIYNDIHTILQKYKGVKSFSPLYYFVENSQVIQGDVHIIIFISMILLGLLYLLLLKNLYLFLNVTATLASSVIIGQFIVIYLFSQASIIALAFSTAITSVSIDYMFHHYLHNYYSKKLRFNTSVFFGFMTTISVFFLLSLIDFQLIQQISIFTISSLTTAYIHFAFIYPYLGIGNTKYNNKKSFKSSFMIHPYIVIIVSLIMLIISILYISFDFDIKKLDYQNQKLIDMESFFKTQLYKDKQSAILITANTIDELISNAKIVQRIDTSLSIPFASLLSQNEFIKKQQKIKDFNFQSLGLNINSIATTIGFKKNYFTDVYNNDIFYPSPPLYTLETIHNLGFDLIYYENKYIIYSIVSYNKLKEILNLNYIQSVDSKVLFENSIQKVYSEMFLYASLSLVFTIFILLLVTKKRFFGAFNYILFPVSLILFYGVFIPLNIMHIFMTFVILAIGIDYGIYMNEIKFSPNTSLAIIYSLISTFAGFGVLIVSDINSLYSIATTAIIGIMGILFVLLFQK